MIFASILLITALTLSAVAAFYSIAGLIAIFSAAPVPIMVMGGALEVGKIVSTVFLHNNWGRLNWKFKTYLVPAVMVLMFLTSIGVFGLLSKAHSDQNLVTGDAQSKVAIYDEKIATERDNIEQAKRALAQMNAQVDQMLGRSDTERGAERAVQIRKNQARERAALQAEITKSQKAIAQLQEERAPFAAETRKIEAEVGPIKYIAALIYGDNPDQNILERAVRWVIILIVVVFDPLALTLILAANRQFEWARAGAGGWRHREDENDTSRGEQIYEEPLVTPPTVDPQITDAVTVANADVTEEEEEAFRKLEQKKEQDVEEFFQRARFTAQALDAAEERRRAEEANAAMAEIEKPEYEADDGPLSEDQIDQIKESADKEITNNIAALYLPKDEDIAAYNDERLVSKFDKESLAKEEHPKVEVTADAVDNEVPQQTLSKDTPILDEYNIPMRRGNDYAVRYRGKVYNLDAFKTLYPSLEIKEDNIANASNDTCGFGDKFPSNPAKGDMFIRIDYLPDRLYKWNGNKWIELDKNSTDSYTYNRAYIDHLIQKLEAGEYEIEDLNEAERAQVEEQIQSIINNKNV